jgi:steroid delta-isomerase-like uncharacterized protein
VSIEDNKALVRRAIEDVINRGNLDAADALVASDYVYRSPGTPEMRGPEGMKQLISMYRGAFPDLHIAIDEQIAEGDNVCTRWTGSGTHRGELMGIPPTGKRINVIGMIISRCAAGKIVAELELLDSLGMLQQLGTIPAPEHAPAPA